MLKKIYLGLIIAILFSASLAFAADESLVITTYYPSPYGSYNELSTNKLLIGTNAASPASNNIINFAGGQASGGGDPAVGHDGDLYYNSTSHNFRYYDGGGNGAWKSFGGLRPSGGGYLRCQDSDVTPHIIDLGSDWQLIEFTWAGVGSDVTAGISGYIYKDASGVYAVIGSSMYGTQWESGVNSYKYIAKYLTVGTPENFYAASGSINHFILTLNTSGSLTVSASRVSFVYLKWN